MSTYRRPMGSSCQCCVSSNATNGPRWTVDCVRRALPVRASAKYREIRACLIYMALRFLTPMLALLLMRYTVIGPTRGLLNEYAQ